MLTLDHVIHSVQNLATASEQYREAGFTVMPGGQHADGITENALIVFADGTYLELLALVAERNRAEATFQALLAENGDRLTGFALQSDDFDNDLAGMRERGIAVGEVVQGSRTRPDGMELRWQMATIAGGFSPFVIADQTDRRLRVPIGQEAVTHANGATGISELLVKVSDLPAATARYGSLIKTPLVTAQAARFELGEAALVIAPGGDDRPEMLTLYSPQIEPVRLTVNAAAFTFS